MVWIVVVVVLAALLGELTRRYVFRGHEHDSTRVYVEALRVRELVIPVRLLASLLLAFAVVSVFNSYRNAATYAATEAGTVLAMGEQAVLLPEAERSEVLGALRCYTRAVAGPDWEAQASGDMSPVADAAADRITLVLGEVIADSEDDAVAAAILEDDSQRIQARILRNEEAQPAVPAEVWILMLVTVAVMIGSSGAFTHPRIGRPARLAILTGTAVVFGLTLGVTYDMGRPFDGLVKVLPTAMLGVDDRLAGLPGGTPEPPCDTEGLPGEHCHHEVGEACPTAAAFSRR